MNKDRPEIIVKNSAIDSIPQDADIVVCQSTLAERAAKKTPSGAQLVQLENFLADPALDNLYKQLIEGKTAKSTDNKTVEKGGDKKRGIEMLKKGIKLGEKAKDKDEAIQAAGELLKEMGCVDDEYIVAMHEREKEVSTYLGMGIAIPHGTSEAKAHVKETYRALRSMPSQNFKGIFHCFSGSKEEAFKIIDMGFHIGIGGVLTFKTSHLDEIVKAIPIEKIVLETDDPYLTPVPHRGERNEPSYVTLVAEKLASILNYTIEETIEVTTNNALSIFDI